MTDQTEKKQTYSTIGKQKKQVKTEKNPNHMYYDIAGNMNSSTATDIGEFYDISDKIITFVADNGIKFSMPLNEFAQNQNLSAEIISTLQNK